MEVVVVDLQIINQLTMGSGIRRRWIRGLLRGRIRQSLITYCPAECYLHMFRALTMRNEIHAQQRLGDFRQSVRMIHLTDQTFAATERLHRRHSHLDLYNIVSASIALGRKVPLAVWNDAQYAELRRHEGLLTVDWSK